MNVICTDGTSFRCDRYELTEKGVKLYSGAADEAPERYETDTDDHQIGFVPDVMLQYILPDGVRPAGGQTAQPLQQPTGQPPQQSTAQPLCHRSVTGVHVRPRSPTYFETGRTSRLSASCSSPWAIQPPVRATANVAVNSSRGTPTPWSRAAV